MNFEEYQQEIRADIASCLDNMGVQPILFVGSGLSQRYYGGPSWNGLLSILAEQCPTIDKAFAYYKQRYPNLIDIGSIFAERFHEWAWGEGRSYFPAELFEASVHPDIYIKYAVSAHFECLLESEAARNLSSSYTSELEALKSVKPHALITTNYDRFLEGLFTEYSTVIGERILRANYSSVGEILKIHGCSSAPGSIVLTKEDYQEFASKKKYLSAKLLTFFSEHPLIFLGYGAEDPNVKAILSDIDEILAPAGELIPNIYIVEWKPESTKNTNFPRERLISIDPQRSVRVKSIIADDFEWVYECFKVEGTIESVSPKLLRALMARTFALIRHDIPRRTVEIDYETLEHALTAEAGLAKLYGITTLDNPATVNAMYPFSLTQVGKELGYTNWHKADRLIRQIETERGINIKNSDNRYHLAIKAGNVSQAHKYSEEAVKLLLKVKEGFPYDLDV